MEHFINPRQSYQRKYDLIGTYIHDTARYLEKQTQRPYGECVEYVQREIAPGGKFALHFPNTMVLVRGPNGDRQKKFMPFNEYLERVRMNRQILSPTLAAYVHPEDKESLLAVYIAGNLAKRKKAKREMFDAEQVGNEELRSIKNAEQNTLKIKNNALSGAHSSPYTILWNKSSHSTLTSTCRTATSYGNANNEKFLYGNRHYYEPDVVKTNLISIINHTDLVEMAQVIEKFKLRCPSIEETMAVIHRSTEMYWRSATHMQKIERLVSRLTEVERAAFVYTGDFYHLAQFNPEFVRSFLQCLSTKASTPLSVEESDEWIARLDDNLLAFASMLCSVELAGGKLGDAHGDGSLQKIRDVRASDYGKIAGTIKNIIQTLDAHSDFIKCFWVSGNLPASIFNLPNIIRRGAITSDTDSTIFTVQYWTEWYVGRLDFDETSTAIATTMVYLASEMIRHVLATISGNMGAAQKDVLRLTMKNEFYFPVFALTSRSKHYFAYISAQEGNLKKHLETEIKGVALRNSNVPPVIMKKAHELIRALMDSIMRREKISLRAVLSYVAEIENSIRAEVDSGGYSLLPKVTIKTAASYKEPRSSNYLHYEMWQEVFAVKYGHTNEPPYTAVKVSVNTKSRTQLMEWIAGMEDRALADRFQKWLTANGKKSVSTLLLPETILASSGIPQEALQAMNLRNLIFQIMESFYLILEAVGFYMKNDKVTRLVSDQKWLTENLSADHVVGSLQLSSPTITPEELKLSIDDDEYFDDLGDFEDGEIVLEDDM